MFEIRKDSVEVKYKDRMNIDYGCIFDKADQEPETIEGFENYADAIASLKKYNSSISEFSSSIGTMHNVEVYYIEDSETGDVLEYAEWNESYKKLVGAK